jgi:hypothetical protein
MEQPLGPLFEGVDGEGRRHWVNLPTDLALGDLLVYDGRWIQRLPLGEDGMVLVVDRSAPLGGAGRRRNKKGQVRIVTWPRGRA